MGILVFFYFTLSLNYLAILSTRIATTSVGNATYLNILVLRSHQIELTKIQGNPSYNFIALSYNQYLKQLSRESVGIVHGCKTLGSSYRLANKTLQTLALLTSNAFADEVSPEVSIGTARTSFLQ